MCHTKTKDEIINMLEEARESIEVIKENLNKNAFLIGDNTKEINEAFDSLTDSIEDEEMQQEKYLSLEDVKKMFKSIWEDEGKFKYLCQTDEPAINESWNNYTDGLREDGLISDYAYNYWSCPFTD